LTDKRFTEILPGKLKKLFLVVSELRQNLPSGPWVWKGWEPLLYRLHHDYSKFSSLLSWWEVWMKSVSFFLGVNNV